jgi:hypothetical protein
MPGNITAHARFVREKFTLRRALKMAGVFTSNPVHLIQNHAVRQENFNAKA